MKIVMPSIISKFQGAFVDERQITDGILIASELIDARERSNIPGLIFKVDLQKAFDNINWGFLYCTMSRFGFGNFWRKWIHWCISNVRFSISLNDSCSELFRRTKGVRQGYTLSPFLFILVVEVLYLMLQKAAGLNLIQGFKPSANELKVNFKKSALVAIENAQFANSCALIFGCLVVKFPLIYLGISLGSKSKSVSVWEIPASVEKQMDGIMRSFLWGNGKRRGWISTMHVQSGNRCFLWNDIWIGDHTLAGLYPSLYRLTRNKHASIRDMIQDSENGPAWDFSFTRNLKEDELQMVAALLGQINALILSDSGDDYLSWNPGNNFSIKSCYEAIEVAGFIMES
ncbi:uncharacterized protein LOC113290874 [Papaver somniferum]|uniref:uncharacterized protein LOC113290874 n=1 Tax=Papaver somniferum TaxID=3469 RepID=UPI000E700C85|nr:uncharacterized protein LOC113290874 [Papaver somniferum]